MDFQSVNEAAQRIKRCPQRVRKLAAAGRIPGAVKLGKTWLIPASWNYAPMPIGNPTFRARRTPPQGVPC